MLGAVLEVTKAVGAVASGIGGTIVAEGAVLSMGSRFAVTKVGKICTEVAAWTAGAAAFTWFTEEFVHQWDETEEVIEKFKIRFREERRKQMEENKDVKTNPGALSELEIKEEISKMNLPSNSNNGKRLKKVVQGTVTTAKPSLAKKFSETFIADDISNIGNYLLFDVLVPALKDTIVNFVTNGINAVIYGDTRPRQSRFNQPYGNRSYTSYSSYSRPNTRPEGSFSRRSEIRYSQEKEPIVESRYDADLVLEELNNCICEYDQATVGDLYDLLGFDSDHTDYKWGWSDLSGATVRKVPGGWLIDLPRPQRL